MPPANPVAAPSGHTPEGGVLVGNADAAHAMVLFEDPQCPYCRQFEEVNGHADHDRRGGRRAGRRISDALLLGPRVGASGQRARPCRRIRPLRRTAPGALRRTASGGNRGLLRPRTSCVSVARYGLTDSAFVSGVRRARYEKWVLRREAVFQSRRSAGNAGGMAQRQPDRFERCSSTGWRSRTSFERA